MHAPKPHLRNDTAQLFWALLISALVLVAPSTYSPQQKLLEGDHVLGTEVIVAATQASALTRNWSGDLWVHGSMLNNWATPAGMRLLLIRTPVILDFRTMLIRWALISLITSAKTLFPNQVIFWGSRWTWIWETKEGNSSTPYRALHRVLLQLFRGLKTMSLCPTLYIQHVSFLRQV